jgi:hypothetical protein
MAIRTPLPRRGTALLVALILLAVLTVIGTAAVTLSSRERESASAKARVSFATACAHAAQGRIWAELAKFGLGSLTTGLVATEMTLPGGTKLAVPAHYTPVDGSAGTTAVILGRTAGSSGGTMKGEQDESNMDADSNQLGQTFTVTARCTAPSGREMELEIGMRFAL